MNIEQYQIDSSQDLKHGHADGHHWIWFIPPIKDIHEGVFDGFIQIIYASTKYSYSASTCFVPQIFSMIE